MSSAAALPHSTLIPERSELAPEHTWDLSAIYGSWQEWETAFEALESGIQRFAARQGTLERAESLLDALQHQDTLGQLAYRVWYYASLHYDQDQRDNRVNAEKQRVQLLMARWGQATAWFAPELLGLTLATVREWMEQQPALATYRFYLEDLFRQQAHVLDEAGERLLSLGSRLAGMPQDAYAALSTADAKLSSVTLSTGETVQVSYGQYRRLLATSRLQSDRRAVYEAYYDSYGLTLNTYAALYNGVLQRGWFEARARKHATTLDAALFGNNIPTTVVENLIHEAKAGAEPFRRYHRLRRRALALSEYYTFDAFVPLLEFDVQYPYRDVLSWIVESVAPLGPEYQRRVAETFAGRAIDVYENQGKRSGAYSAPVYGTHPYMLLNYNDTLEAVFTLAHEMGHSVHTLLAHETQPFVYSDYTIFVAEVPSTLSEALLLDLMLARAASREERIFLLQHAIDGIVGTFYNQVLFADYELQAHRLVERDEPITAERLSALYGGVLQEFWGDALSPDARASWTWARVPHFFQSPYYVYQYATCFASTARLMRDIGSADERTRADAVDRYLALLRGGGSDHPMRLLARAGVDLTQPDAVRAVVQQLDGLVDLLEKELALSDSPTPA